MDGRKKHVDRKVDLELRDFIGFFSTHEVGESVGDGKVRRNVNFDHFNDAVLVHNSTISDDPFLGGDESIVLVHGWNNSPAQKESAARTAFKRLYWHGFRGEMIAFHWPTFYDAEGSRPDSLLPINLPFVGLPSTAKMINYTYNPSEMQAWRSGRALMHLLQQTSANGNTHLFAHSMGNVVAAEALRQHALINDVDPLVKNYVAMEAAVSAGGVWT